MLPVFDNTHFQQAYKKVYNREISNLEIVKILEDNSWTTDCYLICA